MGKDAGKAPDYRSAATEEAQAGALMNRPDQTSPFATTRWTRGPDGTWQQNSGLAGGLGTAAEGLQGQAAGMAQPMDWSQFGSPLNAQTARQEAIDASYGEQTKRLDPRFQQEEAGLRTRLAEQGLDENSQAYKNAMRDFGMSKNDAYGSAMNQAMSGAGDAALKNNLMARQMGISEALQRRQLPMSELQQMGGFLNFMPGFNAAQGPRLFDAANATGQWDMQNAQMQNQFWGDLAGGLMGAAGGAMKFSDERLKRNIRRLGVDAVPGVPLATWEWEGVPEVREIGVIAQDVERVRPECVSVAPNGFKMVDYKKLFERECT